MRPSQSVTRDWSEIKGRVQSLVIWDGWVGFDFPSAFGLHVRIMNDAAMQALGSYEGGRMLFLGLGTGVGSALITEEVILTLELGQLPYKRGETLGDTLGRQGLKRLGKTAWRRAVTGRGGLRRARHGRRRAPTVGGRRRGS